MEVKKIKMEDILPSPNIREKLNEEKIDELAESIKYNGLINPITVAPIEDKYMLISGFRRYFACKKVGLKEIPCIVKEFQNAFDKLLFQLEENEKRENLSNYERAITYLQLFQYYHNGKFKDEFNLKNLLSELLKKENTKYDEVISLIGKSKKTIYRILYPLSNEVMLEYYKNYNISPNLFEKLTGVKDNKQLKKLLDKVIQKDLTLQQVENEVKKLKNKENKENLYKINTFINFIKKIKNNEIEINEEEKKKLNELKELLLGMSH